MNGKWSNVHFSRSRWMSTMPSCFRYLRLWNRNSVADRPPSRRSFGHSPSRKLDVLDAACSSPRYRIVGTLSRLESAIGKWQQRGLHYGLIISVENAKCKHKVLSLLERLPV